jgi:hypothetical protein
MRKHWVNLILHTTARINLTKRKIVTSNFLGIVFRFLSLFFLELFLGLISLPFYFLIKSNKKDNSSFKLRRAITLTSLGTILLLWTIKLIVIFVFSQKNSYEIKNVVDNEILSEKELISSLNINFTNSSLFPPEFRTIEASSNKIVFSGEATPNSHIALFIHSKNDPSKEIEYNQKSNQEGKWQIYHFQKDFYLPRGEYLVYALTFDLDRKIKSEPSPIANLNVPASLSQVVLNRLDYWVNLVTIILILLGVVSTILII